MLVRQISDRVNVAMNSDPENRSVVILVMVFEGEVHRDRANHQSGREPRKRHRSCHEAAAVHHTTAYQVPFESRRYGSPEPSGACRENLLCHWCAHR